jgi:hypothetical protein
MADHSALMPAGNMDRTAGERWQSGPSGPRTCQLKRAPMGPEYRFVYCPPDRSALTSGALPKAVRGRAETV